LWLDSLFYFLLRIAHISMSAYGGSWLSKTSLLWKS